MVFNSKVKDTYPVLEKGMYISSEEIRMLPNNEVRHRFPYCIVWTPIPVLSWIFPLIGHMGICTSSGIIRDFAGPYFVSEDLMAFGNPVKYWSLDPRKAHNGGAGWDAAVAEASEIYQKRMHILFYDNCHSHVAKALNIMKYDGRTNWNMVRLACRMPFNCQYVDHQSCCKTWMPFLFLSLMTFLLIMMLHFSAK